MPLQLSDEEMTVLLTLAGPIDQRSRPTFLQEVAQELEARRRDGEIGEGSVHRIARAVQRNTGIRRRASRVSQRAAHEPRDRQRKRAARAGISSPDRAETRRISRRVSR
jgi:hypothetical protein